MTNAIETFGLTKRYGSITAVRDLNLRIGCGQVFGFLGPNGAGKSTTIRLLLGSPRPTSGSRRCAGPRLRTADSAEIHRRVGYLPGDLGLFARLTGAQHSTGSVGARGMPRRSNSPPTSSTASTSCSTVRSAQLSKGNRQKIGLVAGLHAPPRPADPRRTDLRPRPAGAIRVRPASLRETVAEGRTVFLSSHELDEVQRVADRVAIINDGRLIVTDTVEGLRRTAPGPSSSRFAQPVDAADLDALDGLTIPRPTARHRRST